MKKCCFIIPYFGKFNNYFPLFLKTCAWNKDFNWLVITDDETKYDYPDNFKIIKMSFYELKALIQSKFDFPISLEKPYKLCDYKPAYGYIFEEYLSEYKFWGHCDTDVLMGDLSKFINTKMLDNYDKIFCLGHMTLYKNTEEVNRLFKSKHDGRKIYKEVFSNKHICWFDEAWKDHYNINNIFKEHGKRIFSEDLSLNFRIMVSQFVKTTYKGTTNLGSAFFEIEPYKKCIYLWKNGEIVRFYLDGGILQKEEYAYIHLQKRIMHYSSDITRCNIIQIVANKFLAFNDTDITFLNFKTIKKEYLNTQYWYIKVLPKLQHLKRLIAKYLFGIKS